MKIWTDEEIDKLISKLRLSLEELLILKERHNVPVDFEKIDIELSKSIRDEFAKVAEHLEAEKKKTNEKIRAFTKRFLFAILDTVKTNERDVI